MCYEMKIKEIMSNQRQDILSSLRQAPNMEQFVFLNSRKLTSLLLEFTPIDCSRTSPMILKDCRSEQPKNILINGQQVVRDPYKEYTLFDPARNAVHALWLVAFLRDYGYTFEFNEDDGIITATAFVKGKALQPVWSGHITTALFMCLLYALNPALMAILPKMFTPQTAVLAKCQQTF